MPHLPNPSVTSGGLAALLWGPKDVLPHVSTSLHLMELDEDINSLPIHKLSWLQALGVIKNRF